MLSDTYNPKEIILLTPTEFEVMLTQAADIHSVEMSTSPERIVFSAQAGAGYITFTVTNDGIEIIRHDLQLLEDLSEHRRSHHQKYADLSGSPIEVLQKRNLPLYWNKEWLEEKYAETGSYAALAQKYKREVQGAKASSIANYAREKFNLSPRDKLHGSRDDLVNEYEEVHEHTTQTALAKKYNVTVSSINRWIREAHVAYQEMAENPDLVKNKDQVALHASKHNLLPRTINKWKRLGSSVYSKDLKAQPKQHYHSRPDYERLKQVLYERIDKSDTGVAAFDRKGVALSKEFNVDRSTIARWLKEYDSSRSAYSN